MTQLERSAPRIAIGCGGTGGHLFPGLAVGEHLASRGCTVTLFISCKEVDQEAVKTAEGMQVIVLPAIGLQRGEEIAFTRAFFQSYRAAAKAFRLAPPDAALAMGGFASAPPILAARRCGAHTFLHESNSVPGRANRWLSWIVARAFVGFGSAASGLHTRRVMTVGTPVRRQFQPRDAASCREALGLDPARPVVLVTGGSQGASGINRLVTQALPILAKIAPDLQWFHLAGPGDLDEVRRAYRSLNLKAAVHPFFARMELALGAATVAVSRAGASSLAELAAMRVPSVLVPFPAATDNHQFLNARLFAESGAARLLDQTSATPEILTRLLADLLTDSPARESLRAALAQWHRPAAVEQIAETMLGLIVSRSRPAHPARALADTRDLNRHPSVVA